MKDETLSAVLVLLGAGLLVFTFILGVRLILNPQLLTDFQQLIPNQTGYIGLSIAYGIPLALLMILGWLSGRAVKWGLSLRSEGGSEGENRKRE